MLISWPEHLPWLPAAVIAAGTFVSLQMERACRPQCVGFLRPWPSFVLHTGLILLAWALALAICRRPTFALLAVLAGQLLLIQVNNAKYRALREPFLFSDFGIFSQAIRHPRLYLPFLGLWRALSIGLAIFAALGVGWWLETPAPDSAVWSGMTATGAIVLIGLGLYATSKPLLDPIKDLARDGMLTSVAKYWAREKTRAPDRNTLLPTIIKTRTDLPDIVAIQSESFFDPRRLWRGIRRDLLCNYDVSREEASWHGRLAVPAWGANTMRSEFAFLSGLVPEALDIHRFNPYRQIARAPLRALPAVLRQAGYAATCIHPHPARFFRRDRAFQNLGFERFVDIGQFRDATKCGPYIGDAAVTDRLLNEMQSADGPSFFFVITMENHGPLHLESIRADEWRDFYTEKPPPGCEELTVYLRHLRNADRQLGRLRETLRQRARPCLLVFYGEHIPSMPRVYDALGMPDGRTDYFIEATRPSSPRAVDLKVEDLAKLIIEDLSST
jgi:hypothetical protein